MENNNRIAGAIQSIATGVVMALLALISVGAQETGAQTVTDVIVSVENHYKDLVDLRAKVVQKNILKSISKTQKFEGTLFIKKPGKLRLEHTNGQLILIDGKAALYYSKKSEQLIKKTFTDFEQMNVPVAFLLGAARIRDDFDVLQADPMRPRVLELIPKKPGAAMKKLILQVDDAGRITGLTIFDKAGNTADITFSEIREGVALDDAQFTFTAPKGTEIIE